MNLPGVQGGQLKLAPDVLADVFLGKITKWNDARVAADNRELRLPDLPVVPLQRDEGSGTTFVFTTYLSRVSDAWANGPRAGTTVAWPGGKGARGSDGAAELLGKTPGAICYVETSTAIRLNLATPQLRNKSGAFVKAGVGSFAAAAAIADLAAANFAFDVIDAEPSAAWPIVAPSFALLPSSPAADKVDAARNTMKFFDWAYRNGAEAATTLGFVPLPEAVTKAVRQAWETVKAPDGRPVWPA